MFEVGESSEAAQKRLLVMIVVLYWKFWNFYSQWGIQKGECLIVQILIK